MITKPYYFADAHRFGDIFLCAEFFHNMAKKWTKSPGAVRAASKGFDMGVTETLITYIASINIVNVQEIYSSKIYSDC